MDSVSGFATVSHCSLVCLLATSQEDECLDKVFESCYRDVAPFREIP